MPKFWGMAVFFVCSLALSCQVNAEENVAITERELAGLIKEMEALYAPVARNHFQKSLKIELLWDDSTVNAESSRTEDKWIVSIYGGMARAPGMTLEAMALTICHELGHHLGGAPKSHRLGEATWSSAEGQADYWATSKCLKKYYMEMNRSNLPTNREIPQKFISDCELSYPSKNSRESAPLPHGAKGEFIACVKVLLAVLDFSGFLNSLPDAKGEVSVFNRDPRVVRGTNINNYPKPQCRIDTLYQGTLCTIDYNMLTSESDVSVGQCSSHEPSGGRPLCWFRP